MLLKFEASSELRLVDPSVSLTVLRKIRLSHLPDMTMTSESSGKKCGEGDGKVAGKSQRKVGLVYDETMCKHDTPNGKVDVECPDRIRVIWEKLQLAGVTQRFILSSSRAPLLSFLGDKALEKAEILG